MEGKVQVLVIFLFVEKRDFSQMWEFVSQFELEDYGWLLLANLVSPLTIFEKCERNYGTHTDLGKVSDCIGLVS